MAGLPLHPDRDSEHPGDTPPVAVPSPAPAPAVDLKLAFSGGNLEPTDETPTVISRALATKSRNEDELTGMLRGRKLAHFELLEPIGVGGMAAVIRARDTQLDRPVALKVLPPDMAADPENVRRFNQEARAAAKLDHENIARVFYCGEDQGLQFIAFEYVEGENLRGLLERRGQIPVPEAISYVLQIASGLAHAAARSVVHRDIKPSNIIISPGGRAKLVDMGLARSLEAHHDGALTQSGVTLGTFDYISPEQALEPRQADARSDIYSLGCTFYHMITGCPPVPEGTAAKKLHHHQHIDPVDPRSLNPEISSNVALVIAKMIAKDPESRYQRPEDLIHDLIALAQVEGGGQGKADGVLFVDARLPGPSTGHPVLTSIGAVLVLCVLVVILGQTGSERERASAVRVPAGRENSAGAETKETAEAVAGPHELPLTQAAPTEPDAAPFRPTTARALADYLKSASSARVLIPAAGLSFTRDDQIVFDGKDLSIDAENSSAETKPTLRLIYDATPRTDPWSILTILSGKVKLHGLRFELDSAGADIAMSAISRKGGQLIVDDCEFHQLRAGDHGRIASIHLAGAPGKSDGPVWLASHCFFQGGQHAVLADASLSGKLEQCALGPHRGSLIEFQDLSDRPGAEFELGLQHCSVMGANGAFFLCRDTARGKLTVENTIFARVERNGSSAPAGFLVQEGDLPWRVRYQGTGNAYYKVRPYLARTRGAEEDQVAVNLDAFRQIPGIEDRSVELNRSPWESPDPVSLLENAPRVAFRINTTLASLRQPHVPLRPLGVERCTWGETYQEPLAPIETKRPTEAVARHEEKIVDPALVGSQENVYRTLRQALEDARSGDVILIKHNGPLAVDSVRLERAGMEVTIRPVPGFKPVLTLGKTTDSDAALFRLYESHLRLEELEIHLAPARSEFKAQSVVAIMGDGQVSMKDCLVTLEEVKDVPFYMIAIFDPAGSGVIRMDPQPMGQLEPRVHLDNCFIRGAGDMLAVRSSRPFELRVENTVVALDGSFLVVDGAAKDPGMRNRGDITLKQVTTYLNDYLIVLRAYREEGRASKGLAPTCVRSATDCLFVSASGKPLVHLEGFDSEEQMRRSFSWVDSKHNAYSNYQQLLDQTPFAAGETMPPTPYGRKQWEEFTNEIGRFERVRLVGGTIQPGALAQAPANDFRLKQEANAQGAYGAEIERLPRESEQSRSETKAGQP